MTYVFADKDVAVPQSNTVSFAVRSDGRMVDHGVLDKKGRNVVTRQADVVSKVMTVPVPPDRGLGLA